MYHHFYFLFVTIVFTSVAQGCYDYSNHGTNWSCSLCQHGTRQSPININSRFLKELANPPCAGISFQFYSQVEMDTVNNGNTFQSNVCFSKIALYDTENHHGHYEVTQFHFHSPSEHEVDSRRYDLEIHIVAKKVDGDSQGLTVLGIFFEVTDNDEEEFELFKNYSFPSAEEGSHVHQMALDFKRIFSHVLEDSVTAYRYPGSLTTGSCSENVNWYVIRDPLKITRVKYDRFHNQWTNKAEMPEGNNREIQAMNGRPLEIVRFCSKLIDF